MIGDRILYRVFISLFHCIMILCFSLLILGCETILSEQQIHEKYQNDSVSDFVKDRYVSNFQEKDLKYDPLYKLFPKSISIYTFTNILLNDRKSVMITIGFTSRNDRYLYKPKKEFARFCKIKGGVLKTIKLYRHYLSGLYENPFDNYQKTLNSNLPTSIQVPNSVGLLFGDNSTQTITFKKEELAQETYLETVRSNNNLLSIIYQDAVASEAFGLFACKVNRKTLWKINIEPVLFIPSNLLPEIVVLLTPIQDIHSKQALTNKRK